MSTKIYRTELFFTIFTIPGPPAPAGGRPVLPAARPGDAVGAFPTLRKKSQRGKKVLRTTLRQQ